MYTNQLKKLFDSKTIPFYHHQNLFNKKQTKKTKKKSKKKSKNSKYYNKSLKSQ